MGQVYASREQPPIITRWDITKRNIIRLEIELGMRDEWPDDVPRMIPPPPPRTVRR
jgi:hypothetical protein